MSGFLDLSIHYADLSKFFVQRLQVKEPTPHILIDEIKQMAVAASPRIEDIKIYLIGVGLIMAKTSMDEDAKDALDSLKEVEFLPKKIKGGKSVLVRFDDDFAISDHERYGAAFAKSWVLLDFEVHEVQSLNTLFQSMGLSLRYLSSMVEEHSTVSDRFDENAALSGQLQAKAYALYW